MSVVKDLTNQKFNKLKVLYRNGSSGGKAVWHCLCDCGNETDVIGQYLRNGTTKSCGCLQKERTAQVGRKNAINLTNQHFGFLTAINPTDKRQGSNVIWHCKCSCGNDTYVAASDLTHLKVQSCGCKSNISYGEREIEILLKNNHIKYKREISFPDLKTKDNGVPRFDFGIYQNNNLVRLIEFDGEQHFKDVQTEKWGASFEKVKENDYIKNKYVKQNNIPLVRIPYWERNKITLDMILGNKYLI